ncbi:MAG: bifunctional phosphoribosylaminoimidazolecarboxamide formyltransferase/IMP cyclohydrolase [Deltaproteobacteria bacterium]|nr:bifunctional phosphoribosylaminoimidazolecarboxamide formyltransferase/IMP cyclohydrolase [Deltaproteobacteria bacterium]
MRKINRAIISVTDKTGVAEFARELSGMGVEIISTGGTAELIKSAGVTVILISSFTGFPEMLDGRLKTLHPKIHGGILGIRDDAGHAADMKKHEILPIDMVVVNLYAFEDTIAKGCTLSHAIENIDIGGPTMIRAAAKNYTDVAAVTDPADYMKIIDEMKAKKGMLSKQTRFSLAKKVFELTASYDAAISNYLGTVAEIPEIEPSKTFPDTLSFQLRKLQDLRYGENPHQSAAFYGYKTGTSATMDNPRQLQGKELSYNNILDLSAACELLAEFHESAAVIVKHNNPCGVAVSKDGLLDAYKNAYACDKTSAFGGIVALNRRVTGELADLMTKIFLEAVIAPGYDEEALGIFAAKKNLRLMQAGAAAPAVNNHPLEIKRVAFGALVQRLDLESARDLHTVTKRAPNEKELADLLFAWRVCKHVKSNAIIFAADGRTVGIGAGQMSRIDSTRIAVIKSKEAGLSIEGAALASDAFFPFRDNIDLAASHGVTAVIQPGGSIKDDEVIRAADEHGIAMVVTGIRHFRH